MKNRQRTKNQMRLLRHRRLRARVFGTAAKPRLSVFRSNKHMFVQLVNDDSGNTLLSVSDREVVPGVAAKKKTKEGKAKAAPRSGGRLAVAKKIGITVAEKAKKQGISRVVFDRSGYQYHGIVKALAEGAQEGGLAL